MHGDLRRGAIDLAQLVDRQRDGRRCNILLEPMALRGARDRHDPWLLGEQPRERDLRGRGFLLFRERGEPVDERQIRFPVLRRESRNDVAEVGTVERGLLVDLAREESLAQRTEGHEPDSQLLERR